MNTTIIRPDQVEGAAEVDLKALQDLMNDTRNGTFFVVRSYVSKQSDEQEATGGSGKGKGKHGDDDKVEIVDHFLQHSVNYGRIKEQDMYDVLSAMDVENIRLAVVESQAKVEAERQKRHSRAGMPSRVVTPRGHYAMRDFLSQVN